MRHAWVLLGCLWVWPHAAAAAPKPAAAVEFLGFAHNETATAWRLRRHRHFADGSEDRFVLVRLLGTQPQRLLQTFVETPLQHRPAAGQPPVSAAVLRQRHPDYYRAAGPAAWRQLRHTGRFACIAHDFKDVVVRIGADMDSNLKVEAGPGKRLRLLARDRGPLGFTPICRLFDGHMVPLAHFRHPAPSRGGPLRAELRVFYSHTGHTVAGLCTFSGAEPVPPPEGVVMVTPRDEPLGATGVGMLQMVESQAQSLHKLFGRTHPQHMDAYRTYIGKYF